MHHRAMRWVITLSIIFFLQLAVCDTQEEEQNDWAQIYVTDRKQFYESGGELWRLCYTTSNFNLVGGKGQANFTPSNILWAFQHFFDFHSDEENWNKIAGETVNTVSEVFSRQFISELFVNLIMDCPPAIVLPLLAFSSAWNEPFRLTQAFEVVRLSQIGYGINHISQVKDWALKWSQAYEDYGLCHTNWWELTQVLDQVFPHCGFLNTEIDRHSWSNAMNLKMFRIIAQSPGHNILDELCGTQTNFFPFLGDVSLELFIDRLKAPIISRPTLCYFKEHYPGGIGEKWLMHEVREQTQLFEDDVAIRTHGKGKCTVLDEILFEWRKSLHYDEIDRNHIEGIYLEFGVMSGVSLWKTARHLERMGTNKSTVFGFDAFLGLPEQWRNAPKWSFGLDGNEPRLIHEKSKIVKGFYNETAVPFVRGFLESDFCNGDVSILENVQKTYRRFDCHGTDGYNQVQMNAYEIGKVARGDSNARPKIQLVHMDCDLYSSHIEVFHALAPVLGRGTKIVFDDGLNYFGYEEDAVKALWEFHLEYSRPFQVIAAPWRVEWDFTSHDNETWWHAGSRSFAIELL